jgi:hypothetical protein
MMSKSMVFMHIDVLSTWPRGNKRYPVLRLFRRKIKSYDRSAKWCHVVGVTTIAHIGNSSPL